MFLCFYVVQTRLYKNSNTLEGADIFIFPCHLFCTNKAHEFGHNLKEKVTKDFSLEKMVEETVKVYENKNQNTSLRIAAGPSRAR